jgi:uncharacterized protein
MVRIVVVQPTPFCNIDCRYCYLPGRNDKAVMTQSTVDTLFERVFSSGWASDDLTVIWHAGEPLVVPPEFYECAFESIERRRPASVHIRHSMQTNGMLLSSDWCELFKAWHVGVGVSIDGPKRFNDAHRLTRAGKSTFDQALEGIRLLRREGVPFHVITVLSEESMQAPQELLDFYRSEGIENVCFNVEESEGEHVSSLFSSSGATSRFHRFLGEFWRLARRDTGIQFIREIDGMLPRVFRPAGAVFRNVQVEPFGMLNVDCKGNVSTFSPELLGLARPEYGNFIIGNVHTDTLEAMRRSDVLAAMARDVTAGVEACSVGCEYFSVCGGGAPVNKLFENGSFASARTAFCDLTQKVPIDLILEAFDRLESGLGAADLADLVRGAASRARSIGIEVGS